MANTTNKKTSRKTSIKSKTGTNTKNKKNENKDLNRVWSIVLFGIGALMVALTFIEGSAIWNKLADYMFGIFGFGTYFVGVILLYLAVLMALNKPYKIRLVQLLIALIIFCGAVLVFSNYEISKQESFLDNVVNLWNLGIKHKGASIFSIPLGYLLLATIGSLPAKFFMVIFLIVLVMLVTNITLVDIFEYIKNKTKNVSAGAKSLAKESIGKYEIDIEEIRKKREEQKREKKEKKSFFKATKKDIDIKLDKEEIISNEENIISNDVVEVEEKVNYDLDLPFSKRNNNLLPKKQDINAKEEIDKLIPDIIAHDKLSLACLEVINGENTTSPINNSIEEVKYTEVAFVDTNNVSVPTNNNENSIAKNNLEVDALVQKAIETPKKALEIDSNNQIIMHDDAIHNKFKLPPISLLTEPVIVDDSGADVEMKKNAQILIETLESFGVKTKILDICRGTSVTRYEIQPLAGVKISRITSLADDIALNFAAVGVRIEAPIPGKPAVGIEVPNKIREMVRIRSVFETNTFENSTLSIPICLGKDISGIVQIADLSKMPHLLIAGTTGSGKSVCTNGIILSLLYRFTPEQLKIMLIDPKVVEFSIYNGIPHLIMPVITDPRKAAGALGSAVAEMEKRYRAFAENNVRDITGFNKLVKRNEELEPMPYIVVVIDEMADLMMTAGKEVEDYVCRLAQKSRAAGMHLIVATQRPSVDVITGLIKANIPSRIALSLSSQVDSRTIIDSSGAEKLLGNGDMLFLPVGASKALRIQGAFVSDAERERVINYCKLQGNSQYNEEMIENTERIAVQSQKKGKKDNDSMEDEFDNLDEMLNSAIEEVINAGQASTSMLQRKLRLGYNRAGRIIDQMEQLGIIGPYDGAKPRQVLITRSQWIEMEMNIDNR